MLNKDTIIKVTNKSRGSVVYTIPDLGIRRDYQLGESKDITYDELLKLSYSPGGKTLIQECLVINNLEAVENILGEVEPEYFYTKEDVEYLLNRGTLDQLKDCLDFADEGVIDTVKELAVELEVNDVSKRKAILEKTQFNVDKAIELKNSVFENHTDTPEKKRRAAPIKETDSLDNQPVRRTAAPPKYKVTSMSKN